MYRARRRQWGLGGDLRQLRLQSRVRFVEVRPWIGGLRRSDRAAAVRHERASAMRKVWASLDHAPRTTHHGTTAPLHHSSPAPRRPGGDVLLAGEPRKITDPQPLRGGTAPQPGQRSSLKLSGLIRAHTRRVSGLCGTRVVLAAPDRDTAQWSADSLGRSEVEEVAEATLNDGRSSQEGVPTLVVASRTTIQNSLGANTSITISRSAEAEAAATCSHAYALLFLAPHLLKFGNFRQRSPVDTRHERLSTNLET